MKNRIKEIIEELDDDGKLALKKARRELHHSIIPIIKERRKRLERLMRNLNVSD